MCTELPYESIQSCQVSHQVRHLLLGMMLLCTFAASAGMDPQLLKQTIGQRLGVQVFLVDETPVPGLYLLGTAQGLLYSDARETMCCRAPCWIWPTTCKTSPA